MKIIIIGAPGAGKDTQAKKLAKYFKLSIISSGEILRKESGGKTKTGEKIKRYIDNGNLVPEKLLYKILKKHVGKKKNLILDGIPRSKKQLKFSFCRDPDYVILIKVPKKELIKRIISRGKKEHRDDDRNIRIINKRFKKYSDSIGFIVKHYKDKGNFVVINGNRPIENVFKNLVKEINSMKG